LAVAAATRATLELAENDGTGQLIFTARQCLDVQNLLVGRLNMARSQATEQVLAEQVYSLDPEYDQVDQTDLSETTQIQLEQINTMMRELHNQDWNPGRWPATTSRPPAHPRGGHGIITRLENRVTGLDKTLAELKAHQQGTAEELTRAQAAVGTPFKHAQALLAARADRAMVTRQIAANAEASTGQAGAVSPAQVDLADRLAVDVNGRLTAMEEREFSARWAALSGRRGPSTSASQSRTAVTAADPEAKEAAELEARRRETARREDDARRREHGRGPHM
jgi:hypothetical protein